MKSFLLSSLIFIGTLNAQGTPQQVPPVSPPPPVNGVNPVATPPVNPANPQLPTNQGPQQPPATPQYGPPAQQPAAPYNPYNPYQQQFGGAFMGAMDPQNLKCEMGQCRNRAITLSPGQGFKLECNLPMQCDGLQLSLNVGHDPTNFGSGVSEIDALYFKAPTNGVTINIRSMTGNNVEINDIRCEVMGACSNLRINAGFGVEVHNINFHCQVPGACNGCTINGMSCQMMSMMNGNNNGMMAPGFGYSNQAIPPQQPGYGAPQQAQYPQQQGPPVYPGVQQPQAPQLPVYQGQPMPQMGAPQYPQYPRYI